MKIHPIFIAVLTSAAYAQTPPQAPKPAAPQINVTPATPPTPGTLATPQMNFEQLKPDRVIATIGDEKVTVADFDAIINGLPAQYQAQARGPAKRQFMEQIAQMKVLAHQAQVMHLDQSPEAKQQIAFATENILANMAGKALVTTATVDKEAMQKYYDAHSNEFATVSAHHILIRFKGSPVPLKEGQKDLSEEEALAKTQELIKQLKAGGDFAKLAEAESADAGSGAHGGDLGSFKRGQMVKPFEDAAFSMKVGEISEPVKSQFGYHIIRVDKIETKTFDEAKPEIEARLKPEIAKKQMDDLQKAAGVTLDEAYFGPAPAPKAPPSLAPTPAPAK